MMRSCIRNARSQVAALREALLAPSIDDLLAQLPALENAARQLENASPDTGGSAAELDGLSQDLRRAAALIEHGYSLQLGWARILAAATAEYRPDGQPASLQPQTSVSMEG